MINNHFPASRSQAAGRHGAAFGAGGPARGLAGRAAEGRQGRAQGASGREGFPLNV